MYSRSKEYRPNPIGFAATEARYEEERKKKAEKEINQ
jgi:hypothetical protein